MMKTPCIINGCKRRARVRGLCDGCYLSALRTVHAGQTTWAELIDAGLALGDRRKERLRQSIFLDALAKVKVKEAAQ